MGLFGGRNDSEVGTFVSPHSLADTRRLVLSGVASQISDGNAFEARPLSITNSIVVSELSDNRVVISAGNTTTLLYSLTVDLTETGSGTVEGHAYLDRPFKKISMWTGNAIELIFGIRQQLTSASVSIKHWKNS